MRLREKLEVGMSGDSWRLRVSASSLAEAVAAGAIFTAAALCGYRAGGQESREIEKPVPAVAAVTLVRFDAEGTVRSGTSPPSVLDSVVRTAAAESSIRVTTRLEVSSAR